MQDFFKSNNLMSFQMSDREKNERSRNKTKQHDLELFQSSDFFRIEESLVRNSKNKELLWLLQINTLSR